ncbi:MAG: hypothetical protein AAGJ11_10560 [Bacteroidota bacterium]
MRWCLALAFLLAASGCDEAFVDPFLRDAAPYSLYGTLVADFTPQTQRVRVQRVRATVEAPTDTDAPEARIDGRVESADPASGRPLVWAPRSVVYDDGTVGTVFERAFQPEPGDRVEVVYTDADGREVRAETTLPARPPGVVGEPRVTEVDAGDVIFRRQTVTWTATRFQPEAVVDYSGVDSLRRAYAIQVVYPVVPTAEGTAEVDVALTRDLQALAALTGVDDDDFIAELRVRMDVRALDDALPPADVIPSEDLGRVFLAGATMGRVVWTPLVKPFDTEL